MTANKLRRMWTLTCADQTHDRAVMVRRVGRFMRRWRQVWGPTPYVWVLELHKSGAWHAHVALPAVWRSHGVVSEVWGHGNVWVSRKARWRYLAKYLGKQVDAAPKGAHSYEVGQGYAPEVVRLQELGWNDAWRAVVGLMGGEFPAYTWRSSESEDWRAPPTVFLAWQADP